MLPLIFVCIGEMGEPDGLLFQAFDLDTTVAVAVHTERCCWMYWRWAMGDVVKVGSERMV